jgi:hypothetical protein
LKGPFQGGSRLIGTNVINCAMECVELVAGSGRMGLDCVGET